MGKKPIAVVTGAAGGIGRQLSLRLAKLGYDLAAIDADTAGLESLADEIKSHCDAYLLDVTDPQGWDQVAEALADRRVGLLVNNAGLLLAGKLLDCKAAELQRVINVNLVGAMLGCRAIGPLLVESAPQIKRRERPLPVGILNVASIFGPLAPPGFAAYNASKAGLIAFSKTLRGELRPAKINVTVVLPGITKTGLFDKAHYTEDHVRVATQSYLTQADLSAEEVADAILKAYRKRRRVATIGRRAGWYAMADRWLPGITGRIVARRARRVF